MKERIYRITCEKIFTDVHLSCTNLLEYWICRGEVFLKSIHLQWKSSLGLLINREFLFHIYFISLMNKHFFSALINDTLRKFSIAFIHEYFIGSSTLHLFTETCRNGHVGSLKSHQAFISHAGPSLYWHGPLFSPHSLSFSDLLSTTLHISHQLVVSSDTSQVSYLFWQLCV